MSGLVRLAGDADVDMAVRFQHAEPSYVAGYGRIFGELSDFDQRDDMLRFSASVFELPSPLFLPYLAELLSQQADALAQRSAVGPLAKHVTEWIGAALSGGSLGADLAAHDLHMSRRTLHRRLREERMSYQELLETTRRQRADLYLREHRSSLGDVAFLLGFGDYSSFHRAVRRRFGQSPQEYRRRLRRVAGG